MQRPSIGRIVHYHSHGSAVQDDGTQLYHSEPRAAIITAVPERLEHEPYDGCPNGKRDINGTPMWIASLTVLAPAGIFFNETVPYAEEPTPGHWSWPPRS